MIFHPQNIIKTNGSFTFWGDINAIAHPCLNKNIIKEFWHNFTFQGSTLKICEGNEFVFSIGNAKPLSLDGYDYTLRVTPEGFCVCGKGEDDLRLGFMVLLDRIAMTDTDRGTALQLDCCEIRGRADAEKRMVHYCVFPETELWELQRFIRFCGALQFTHVVLEFWGMLRLDAMSELAWPFAFTKEQIRPIMDEAHDLGLEIVPMFNHWGHATAGRVIHGKHVVLDQNPALQSYFSEDGWCWDIKKPKVKALLREIRNELIALCGAGDYFHIGCDEAYNFSFSEADMGMICDFINEIDGELREMNRRAIIWGDMILFRHPDYNPENVYTCNAPTAEAETYFLSHIDKHVVIADWQYHAKSTPVETPTVFKNAGFDCLLCPWNEGFAQFSATMNSVSVQGLAGYIHTTWHTLSTGMPYVLLAGVKGLERGCTLKLKSARTYTAALMRKVMPVCGDYQKAGWSKLQVGFKW